MPNECEQDTPEQLVLILDIAGQGADHVAQVETPWYQAALSPTIVPCVLEVALSQISILLQVKKKQVDRRANELVDPLADWCLEGDIHLAWADIAALVYESLYCVV